MTYEQGIVNGSSAIMLAVAFAYILNLLWDWHKDTEEKKREQEKTEDRELIALRTAQLIQKYVDKTKSNTDQK